MKTIVVAGAMALMLSLASEGAHAKDIPAAGVTIEDIVAWLQGAGYQAKIDTTKTGGRSVESSTDGSPFHVYLYDCKGVHCGSLQFSEGFDTKGAYNAGEMNDWNLHNRWGRAYIDKVNDPWVEMDVDLTPGGTYELLNDEFATWRATLANFRKTMSAK
jgi:hypothetical protein